MVSDAVVEVMLRYELGDFPPRVRARLEEIYRADPPDAVDRLEKAASYLEVGTLTRSTLERIDALLVERSRTLCHRNTHTGESENARPPEAERSST